MNKLQKVYEAAKECGAGAFLFIDNINRRYLSGFNSSAGALVVDKDGGTLFLDFRYYEMATIKQSKGLLAEGLEVVLQEGSLFGMVCDLLAKKAIKKIAVDGNRVTAFELQLIKEKLGVEVEIKTGVVEEFRKIKSPEELENIKRAQAVTDAAFSHVLGFIREGVTENEVAAELEYYIRRNGCTLAFDTICVSGTNSSLPHGVPSDKKLTMNSFLTMDFGAAYDGYCSDMTRTVVLGEADDDMKKVYNTVLEAQERALAGIKAGITGKEADALARDHINACGFEGAFGHSLGHSLGMEIHEGPNFAWSYDKPIPAGVVMSVEPGIYLGGKYGVRIEDIVYVTENGCENLTSSKKVLIEIK